MRTADWPWCMSRRRRTKRTKSTAVTTQSPQRRQRMRHLQPTVSLPSSHQQSPKNMQAVRLSAFAEEFADEGLLSDMDFDLCDEPPQPQVQPAVDLVMDTVTHKWTGNEDHFQLLFQDVDTFTEAERIVNNDVFTVDDLLQRQWRQDAIEHNSHCQHAPNSSDDTLDIRSLASEFMQRRSPQLVF